MFARRATFVSTMPTLTPELPSPREAPEVVPWYHGPVHIPRHIWAKWPREHGGNKIAQLTSIAPAGCKIRKGR